MGTMSILDAAAYAIGEAAAYVIGRITGKIFHLEPKSVRRIGENIVIGAILGAAILVTIIYS